MGLDQFESDAEQKYQVVVYGSNLLCERRFFINEMRNLTDKHLVLPVLVFSRLNEYLPPLELLYLE